jgi:thioredoxin 1
MNDFTLRLITTLALIALGLLAYAAYSRLTVQRAQNRRIGLESARPGLPTILYFTTPACAPCRTVQAPAIEQVTKAHAGSVQVIRIDAQERPDIADHWGVLSVPTTFIIDRAGRPRFFNPGIVRAEKLEQQLVAAGLTTVSGR